MDNVTAYMRGVHYDVHGYMVSDIEILNWYKSNKKQEKEEKIEYGR